MSPGRMLGVPAVPAILRAGTAASQATCSIYCYSIFPENSATRGTSWQTGHSPAVRMQQQEQETEIVPWVRALINCRACLSIPGGSGRALWQLQALASQVLPQPVALCRQLGAGTATVSVQLRADKGSSESDSEKAHSEQTTFSSLP